MEINNEEISYWRAKIDQLEDDLLRCLNERARYAIEIGHIKRKNGLPVYDEQREVAILERIAAKNPGPLPEASITTLFRSIIHETRELEQKHHDQT
jgi:chorismate mutase